MDAQGVRDAWTGIDAEWSATIEQAVALPEPVLHAQVNEEWSFVDTLRHLVYVTDAWVRRTILSDRQPYHRLGLPPDNDPKVRAWGIDIDAQPSLAEVLAARDDRRASVRDVVEQLTPSELDRICAPNPAPGWPPQATVPVSLCLTVLVDEERAHHGYAVRDLTILEPGWR